MSDASTYRAFKMYVYNDSSYVFGMSLESSIIMLFDQSKHQLMGTMFPLGHPISSVLLHPAHFQAFAFPPVDRVVGLYL